MKFDYRKIAEGGGDYVKAQGGYFLVSRRSKRDQPIHLYAQNPYWGECQDFYRAPEKSESTDERSSEEEGSQMAKCKIYICHIRQPLGESNPCSSKERRFHSCQK